MQYHNFKEETNVLIEGKAAILFTKIMTRLQMMMSLTKDLGKTELAPTSVVHIVPKVLHRLEALTDVLLYETSTPYLDDVIRVQDDKSRNNGRVLTEHR